MSALILSHKSAASYWLSVSPTSWSCAAPASPGLLQRAMQQEAGRPFVVSCDDYSRHAFTLDRSLFGGMPIHVLVPDERDKRKLDHIVCHADKGICKADTIYQIKESLFVVSPQACLLQMARSLPDACVAQLANAFCAHYYIRPEDGMLISRDVGVTTVRQIKSFANRASSAHGSAKVKRILRYAVDNVESPKETELLLQLCLPYRQGGCGLPMPVSNQEIKPGRSKAIVEQNSYRPDLSWQVKHVAVEYDGRDFHLDVHKDKRRINELTALGWTVFVITKETLHSQQRFVRAAAQISRALGHRLRLPEGWEIRNRQLRAALAEGPLAEA